LPPRVLRPRRGGKGIQQIAGLVGGLGPVARRRGEELGLERVLPRAQRFLVRLDLGDQPAHISRLLRGHAAMRIQADGVVRHRGAGMA
jgi:hypothetical protein